MRCDILLLFFSFVYFDYLYLFYIYFLNIFLFFFKSILAPTLFLLLLLESLISSLAFLFTGCCCYFLAKKFASVADSKLVLGRAWLPIYSGSGKKRHDFVVHGGKLRLSRIFVVVGRPRIGINQARSIIF